MNSGPYFEALRNVSCIFDKVLVINERGRSCTSAPDQFVI